MRDLVDAIRPLLGPVMSEIGVQESDWNNLLAGSTDSTFADVALPCHSLSKVLRKSPNTIADEILENLGTTTEGICHVSSINGFLNFSADPNWLCEILQELSLIHISEPTRPLYISYAVFCLKKTGMYLVPDLHLNFVRFSHSVDYKKALGQTFGEV